MQFYDLLKQYQKKIEKVIKQKMINFGLKTDLRDACEYSLMNGGKRLRPAIVMMLAKSLGHDKDVLNSALAIEYFHTASLVADDLPCMDNDDTRRNRPSTHKVYGENIALLVTYSLIAEGYRCIYRNVEHCKKINELSSLNWDYIGMLALENATYNTGILGAANGQFLDIFSDKKDEKTIRDIIRKKTVTLFEISFVFGWLFSGGYHKQLNKIKQLSNHFGMAFQIADDFDDIEQDKPKSIANYVLRFGEKRAIDTYYKEIDEFEKIISYLCIYSDDFKKIVQYLKNKI